MHATGLMCRCFSPIVFVNTGGKVLSAGYHPQPIVFFRHGVAFLPMLSLFMPRHGWRIEVPRRPGLQVVRGIVSITSSILYFTGLATRSLATAAAISLTQPLVVTALSLPLLGEKIGPHRWAAVVFGFTGTIIMIVRPGVGGELQWAVIVGAGLHTAQRECRQGSRAC